MSSAGGRSRTGGVAHSGRSSGEVNTHVHTQVQLTLACTQAHTCAQSCETATWESRRCSEAPLHAHQGVAGRGSEDGSGLVTCDVSSVVHWDGGLNQRVLVPCRSGLDQDVCSNFVPG